MTDPRFASSEDRGRFYRFPDQEPMISVTSVINVLSKPALVPWSAKLAAERAMKHENIWHGIQEEEGDDKARKWISAAATEFTKMRMTLGSAVHWMCENNGRLQEPEVQDKLMWYLDTLGGDKAKHMDTIYAHLTSYQRFLADFQPYIIEQEQTVANLEHGYAGTLDAVVQLGHKVYLMDIKTGGAYNSHALQLAAYRYCRHAVRDDQVNTWNIRAEGGFVLELKPKSYKVHWMRCGEQEFEAFLAALRLKKWSDEGGVIGEQYR